MRSEQKRARQGSRSSKGLTTVGFFAGIGGIELGLERAGHRCVLLCEVDTDAQRVLTARFAKTRLRFDIRKIKRVPKADLWSAGFPCKDLSQAGLTAGIKGKHSGLVHQVFRLLPRRGGPTWLLFENVPFMLQLDRGSAMRSLIEALEKRGFKWAYRVVDTRTFGLPQRRRRVVLLASRTADPKDVLLADDTGGSSVRRRTNTNCGFYWTEGTTGLGWAVDSIPTLKGGSSVGIPSAPAIWQPVDDVIGTPDIRDAERLQGFPQGWTSAAATRGGTIGARWRLIGNAVSVPLSTWLGRRLVTPGHYDWTGDKELQRCQPWPNAAWGDGSKRYTSEASAWPVQRRYKSLQGFLRYPLKPLSLKAASGFYSRALASSLRFDPHFLKAMKAYVRTAVESVKGGSPGGLNA